MNASNSDRIRLSHMRDAIVEILTYLEEDPQRGNRTRSAIICQLEIIGEAGRYLSTDCKSRYPNIPWKDIVNMRHHLAHGYYQVSIKNLWDTVDNDLEPLHDTILRMLDDPAIR
jgi:uncharacterized protein with HEPN domain